jgi:hypothetical protein
MPNENLVIDHLIAYWHGDPNLPEEIRRFCRKLTEDLARSLSALDLVALQEEPLRHRAKLERALAKLIPATSPPPKPVAQSSLSSQVTGNGNVMLQSSTVGGSIRVQTASRPEPRTSVPSPTTKALEGSTPIRILFLGSNPRDSLRLRLDEEVREIDQALARADLGKSFELCQKWAVRGSDLQFHLLRHRPRIVHFSGHGSEENAIFLESDQGESRPVTGPALARLFAQFNRHIRCVVLNACYSDDQAAAIAEHIDCVVGMSTEVIDQVAIRFAASFYQALAFGCNVQAAFEMSCSDLDIGDLGQAGVPRLLSTRCNPETVSFVRPQGGPPV